jgi:hypothetical protein
LAHRQPETADMPDLTRAAALRMLAAGLLVAGAGSAVAQEGVKLFRVITQKDEIVIGVTTADLAALPGGGELEKIATKLRAAGQLEVWRYAVRKAANGDLELAPSSRVMLFPAETLRLEPYATPLKVRPAE